MRRFLALPTIISIILFAAACGGDSGGSTGPSGTGPAGEGVAQSADGLASISGRAGLTFSFAELRDAPPAPSGWQFMGPVYQITARDRNGDNVSRLDSNYTLNFTVGDLFPATVLVYENGQWTIVPSESDSHGNLMAEIDHLTPYAAARPSGAAQLSGSAGDSAPSPPASDGLPTIAAGGRTPRSGVPTQVPTIPAGVPTVPSDVSIPTFSPAATVAVNTVSTEAAKAALEAAVKAIKNRTIIVTGAAGYTGTVSVPIPGALQDVLGAAVGGGGVGYYGLYNGVNEAAYVEAAGGSATGALTLLVEPKTSMPGDAESAKTQLQELFPGIPSTVTQVTATSESFVFYVSAGSSAYAFGFVSYEGVALAYAISGSGAYQSLVPES